MAKCMAQWTDPVGRHRDSLGTLLCGRALGHPGNHARQGFDGSWAMWTRSGELVMAVQQNVGERPDPDRAEELGA